MSTADNNQISIYGKDNIFEAMRQQVAPAKFFNEKKKKEKKKEKAQVYV